MEKKVVVVTGAAGGIGQAIVINLLEQGYQVAMLDKDQAGLNQIKESQEGSLNKIESYTLDVSDEYNVSAVMQQVADDFGRFDVLVNNAGILKDGLLLKAKEGKVTQKLPYEDWQTVININLTGVFLCGREAAEQMIRCGNGGVIINMTSLARNGNFGQSSYSATKAGVEALTVTWAQELARYSIRSAGIAPGVVKTRMTAGMKSEALDALSKKIPSGRLGHPDEIASTIQFILSNQYINGRIIEIDGGLRF